ncbi:MAG TPA: ABC transporter ATP-binding protein [Nitrospiraceae bacterium]|jgi:iron(III) transport system ATP-binding protein
MLKIENLSKKFTVEGGHVRAVEALSLNVPEGSFFTLLGPSGCGKTTTLRCIAGLEFPDEGEIEIGGTPVFSQKRGVAVLPEAREVGMVFQSYAIWPHMDVFHNVAFPLRVGRRKLPHRAVKERVDWALSLVQLDGFQDRPAPRLSGGQQQRVALARALVAQPKLLLLDEPLSNLDAKLREDMRVELRRLQTSVGITTIYVTHDQAEALAMSDMIAVMNSGKIVQLGSPREIYEKPLDRFIVGFLGNANLISGKIGGREEDGFYRVETDEGPVKCTVHGSTRPGAPVMLSIRPEDILIFTEAPAENRTNSWTGSVGHVVYLGDHCQCEIVLETGTVLKAKVHPGMDLSANRKVYLTFDPGRCVAVPA